MPVYPATDNLGQTTVGSKGTLVHYKKCFFHSETSNRISKALLDMKIG
jgi:hypothetical protein